MLKKCTRCEKILPSSHFAPESPYCRICRRDKDWKQRYSITPEQYYELYEKQQGKCLICGKNMEADKYLVVDHNKETGEVRGLLCNNCNTGIGMFRENVMALGRAIKYLALNGVIK